MVVKFVFLDSRAMIVTQNTLSDRASTDIAKRNTNVENPVCASIAISNAVDPTSIGPTWRSATPMSTLI